MAETSSVRYLDTVQPDWEDLSLACELLELRRREPDSDLRTSALDRSNVRVDKIKGIIRLLRQLELLDGDVLTDRGRWVAKSYTPPAQQIQTGPELSIGLKTSLSSTEQLLLWMVIYYEHQLPMLAALHQLAVETVPSKQDSHAVPKHAARIEYLYPSVESDESWKPRVKVHFKWLEQLGLATDRLGRYVLTEVGEDVFERVEEDCPDEWDTIQIHTGPRLSDFG